MSGTLNVVLASYYKTSAPGQIAGNFDISRPLALRALWEATGGGQVKISSATAHHTQHLAPEIELLGGFAKASAALDENRDWLQAWDQGHAQGVELARARWVEHLEQAQAQKQSQPVQAPQPPVPVESNALMHRVLRGF